MDYYGSMPHFPRLRPAAAVAALALAPSVAPAQSAGIPPVTDTGMPPALARVTAARDAELFYEVLMGEITAQSGDPGTGYTLMLEAARSSGDERIYKRATDMALQSRAGDAALAAARAWKAAVPTSREANRYLLQILIALNRVEDTPELLRQEVENTPLQTRTAVMQSIAQLYTRASDKAQAARVVEKALADDLANPSTGPAAWLAIGQVRLSAGNKEGALQAVLRAQDLAPLDDAPVPLALELIEEGMPDAEAVVTRYFDGKPTPELRMAYARVLLSRQRYADAARQMDAVTREQPTLAEAWLVQATLQLQSQHIPEAEASLQRYEDLVRDAPRTEALQRGLNQSYLVRAQIAESRKDYAAAENWLARIDDAGNLLAAQTRRALLLAKQGKVTQARALLRATPALTPEDERLKLMAEVQMLRDVQKYAEALEMQEQLVALEPDDNDLVYDQAMLAERAGKPDVMERLLRRIIARQPDYHAAYNALGYSLADRGIRLPEARQLIVKALEYAPGDPFITDSLAWVEFRQGNRAEALKLLEFAYKARPDAEIAAHLGEVLWSLNRRDQALAIWREGLRLNPDNDTLQATLKRLGARP